MKRNTNSVNTSTTITNGPSEVLGKNIEIREYHRTDDVRKWIVIEYGATITHDRQVDILAEINGRKGKVTVSVFVDMKPYDKYLFKQELERVYVANTWVGL